MNQVKIEDIFKLLDALKGNTVLKEQDNKSSKKKENRSTTITLPKIQISEDWGKKGTVDRNVLKTIVERASAGSKGKDPLRKLESLNTYIDFVISNVEKDFSISKLISSIILIETMMKMFNSFSYGPSGFLNEAFMSVFYGANAEQVPASKASGVEDVVIRDKKQYISLKTLDQKRTDIEGSLRLLQTTLNDDEHGNQISYHIFIKQSVKDKIDSLRMYEIPIKREFIPIFERNQIDSSKAYMGLVYVLPEKPKEPVPDIAQQDATKDDGVIAEQQTLDWSNLELKTITLSKGQSGKLRDTTEFRVPESVWKRFVTSPQEGYYLNLSQDRYKTVLQRATEMLDKQVLEIFLSLDRFSTSITSFFASENTKDGLKAYQEAKNLEQKTSKIINK